MRQIGDCLYEQELRLLRADVRHSETELRKLLAEEFIEIGSLGQVYSRDMIIASLAEETATRILVFEFQVRIQTPDLALVTYRAEIQQAENQRPISSWRSSLWKRTGQGWQMVFHQGTPIPAA
jgi:hypothetical protein